MEGLLVPECRGPRMEALRGLVELTRAYCEANAEERPVIAKKIERQIHL